MNSLRGIFLFGAVVSLLYSQEKIQVVAMPRAPQPENVEVKILYPQDDQVFKGESDSLRIRVRGFALGVPSSDARAEELPNSQMEQTLHIVIDNKPFFPKAGPSIDAYEDQGKYNEAIYSYKIPFSLSSGKHLIRVYPCRSYGESLKGEECFDMAIFYVGRKQGNLPIDIEDPLLTYNEPGGKIHFQKDGPILLDFYVSNCVLSSNGYRIRVWIDGHERKILDRWQPYYIYGLEKGVHKIRLQLIDSRGKVVQKQYNDIERIIEMI